MISVGRVREELTHGGEGAVRERRAGGQKDRPKGDAGPAESVEQDGA